MFVERQIFVKTGSRRCSVKTMSRERCLFVRLINVDKADNRGSERGLNDNLIHLYHSTVEESEAQRKEVFFLLGFQ